MNFSFSFGLNTTYQNNIELTLGKKSFSFINRRCSSLKFFVFSGLTFDRWTPHFWCTSEINKNQTHISIVLRVEWKRVCETFYFNDFQTFHWFCMSCAYTAAPCECKLNFSSISHFDFGIFSFSLSLISFENPCFHTHTPAHTNIYIQNHSWCGWKIFKHNDTYRPASKDSPDALNSMRVNAAIFKLIY